ncbi:conserved Plasmodium protein, unknown function [Plasmodium ovale]|uniref:Nuclear nucleic acid-binding protein C1D n=2 Tax=Plasmodium ovale TaxID=36330 RepID=A0A1A8W451_PLAOA|nr:conserved Plasmodium protein, unknown function [Plasmodium ovale curtisi]SBS99827.1 conserved Plasmodium protein, unknown function [Plasmodium ovale curtisi]SCP05826.1 conserved Plasmodium protein, unknown function [Plasmodium ovale]
MLSGMDEHKNDKTAECKTEFTLKMKEDDNLQIHETLGPAIKEFQTNFGLINENYSLKDLEKVLNPIEYADYNSFFAYAICSIFYSYLKISGDFLNNHPIKNELKKVQTLMKEINERSQETNEDKKSLTINKEASKRIVDSCISYNKNLKKRKYH